MGYEEFVFSALSRGKPYDQLPATLQSIIAYDEYQLRVRDYWIARGAEWSGCPAQSACGETEFYETLVKAYKNWLRVFPYHLAGYVCRVMRVTPFKYYSDVITAALVAERPYHQLPNFTAADAVRVLGIGRNEYIAMLNACKGRRLLWRVNRTSVAKEVMPTAPQAIKTEPWWRVACVNLGDGEFRELGVDEMAALKSAGMPGACLVVGDLNRDLLLGLWRKGLVYLEVPVQPTDRFTIPPLEGFVSNKDAAAPLGARAGVGGPGTDPLEALMYGVFVANSERLTVQELAGILNQNVPDVCTALSMACRLGFATKVDPTGMSSGSRSSMHQVPGSTLLLGDDGDNDMHPGSTGAGGGDTGANTLAAQLLTGGAQADGRAVALVLDAEATSFLMMGALSPGLKRHAVTLFEGGRVAGAALITELTSELWASHAEGQAFEGDMARLAQFAGALATCLDIARRAAGPSCAVELLRKESLAGLQPAAAAKVLATAYCALLPVTPLPHPPLPLALSQPSAPAYFGPTAHFMSPWSALALYHTAGCGPVSVALCAGQRLWRLPNALAGATHALVWCWDIEVDAARAKTAGLSGLASDGGPSLVEGPLLLYTLNELLTRSAVLVQPINAAPVPPSSTPALAEHLASNSQGDDGLLDGGGAAEGAVVDIPLPLRPESTPDLALLTGGAPSPAVIQARGILRRTSEQVVVPVRCGVLQAVQQLGLAGSVGMLRVIQLPGQQRGMQHGRGGGNTSSMTRTAAQDAGSGGGGGSSARRGVGGAAAGSAGGDGTGRLLPGEWLPLSLHLGLPMYCLPLCKAVCAQAEAAGFLTPAGQAQQIAAQLQLQHSLDALTRRYATWCDVGGDRCDQQGGVVGGGGGGARGQGVSYGVVDLPVVNLLFDGAVLAPLDLAGCVQGVGLICM